MKYPCIHDCECCGSYIHHEQEGDAFCDRYGEIEYCDTCSAIAAKYPDIFEWVQGLIKSKVGKLRVKLDHG